MHYSPPFALGFTSARCRWASGNKLGNNMATYIRNNAWNDGGTFSNSDLLWYAQGVGQMMSRPLDATDSWWFFATIHGEYISGSQFPGWADIPGPPNVPALPLPSQGVRDRFWNQCQHQSWFSRPGIVVISLHWSCIFVRR